MTRVTFDIPRDSMLDADAQMVVEFAGNSERFPDNNLEIKGKVVSFSVYDDRIEDVKNWAYKNGIEHWGRMDGGF